METAIVFFIIAMAAVYVIRKFAKPMMGKGSGCGCASESSCATAKPSFKSKGKLVEFNPRAVGTSKSACASGEAAGCGCSQGRDCDCGPDDAHGDGVPTTRLQ